jgi:DNA (cytosine-5)-methyltransferase 1
LSVCSGIEAATQAWHPLGWQCAGVSEIEPFPRAVLEQRLGAVPVDDGHRYHSGSNSLPLFGDFTKIEAHHVGPVDLLVGGTPCQSFSIAGKRLGLDDPRGNLTLEFLALARRVRPRWIVWENVPGVLSHDKGRTMGTFLRLVGECGFRWAYRVLDAQYVRVGRFGRAVPQRRRRVFLVGYSGAAGVDPRAVLFDRESLRGNPAPRREAGQGVAADVAPSLVSSGRGVERCGETRGQDPVIAVANSGEVSYCIASSGQASNDAETETETLIAHALRGEGFDASEDGTGRGTPLVPVQYGITIHGTDKTAKVASFTEVAGSLRTKPPGSQENSSSTAVVAFSAKDYGADAMEDCSPTLRAGGHTGSHANAGVMPAVAFAQNSRDEVRLFGEDGATVGALGAEPGMKQQCYVAANWRVRRLTPRECERLQAFPDDFTKIEWRGKPADKCPDGPRYKALGNSMAVNVMCWIGERIAAVDALANELDKAA